MIYLWRPLRWCVPPAQIVRAVDGHIVASASTVERVASERLSVRSDKVIHPYVTPSDLIHLKVAVQ